MSRKKAARKSAEGNSPTPPASATLSAAPLPAEPVASSFTLSWLLSTYIIVLSAGFAVLRSPLTNVNGNELSVSRAIFTVINAVTLTGFEQAIGVNELRTAGQVAVFLLMTIGTWISLVVGGSLVTRIVRLPFTDKQIVVSSLIAIITAALLGMIGLSGDCGGVWPGLFAGVSALGNSGMFLNHIGSATTVPTQVVLLPLSILGGLGIPVLIEIALMFHKHRPLSQHSLAVLSMSGLAYILGLLCVVCLQAWGLAAGDPGRQVAVCSAVVINARSAGFPLTPVETFTRSSQWFIMALMALGAAPGGTGGGIKVTTPLILCRGLIKSYRGEKVDRLFTIAAVWVVGYFVLVCIGTLTLLTVQPEVPPDRLLLITLSAASNVGLSHDPISIVSTGLYMLGLIALLGRLLPLVGLYWVFHRTDGTETTVG